MIGAVAAALALQAAPDTLGPRIRDSSEAAQALQGPLDGAWVVKDAQGRVLYRIQIADPPGGGAIGVAWRDPDDRFGVASHVRRTAQRLTARLGAGSARLLLHKAGPLIWRGVLVESRARAAVALGRQ